MGAFELHRRGHSRRYEWLTVARRKGRHVRLHMGVAAGQYAYDVAHDLRRRDALRLAWALVRKAVRLRVDAR